MQDENNPSTGYPENTEKDNPSRPIVKRELQMNQKLLYLSVILNIVMLVGLMILYIMFFTTRKAEVTKIAPVFQKEGNKSIPMVYVNIDSLNAKYEFVKVLKNDLESTGKKLQSEILSEQNAFEKEAADFQKQVANNAIPEAKAKIIYEALMEKQQAIGEKKDRYTQEVANKELDMNMRLLDTVTNFLKRYNRKFNYDYILGMKTAGEILIANDTLNITEDVLNSLNKEYSARKK
jgi:outer membrane protein